MIIGEFGPVNLPGVATMTLDDCSSLMDQAENLGVSYLAWTFHMRCSPNLLEDASGGGCGVGMPLSPTTWGELLRARLSRIGMTLFIASFTRGGAEAVPTRGY